MRSSHKMNFRNEAVGEKVITVIFLKIIFHDVRVDGDIKRHKRLKIGSVDVNLITILIKKIMTITCCIQPYPCSK